MADRDRRIVISGDDLDDPRPPAQGAAVPSSAQPLPTISPTAAGQTQAAKAKSGTAGGVARTMVAGGLLAGLTGGMLGALLSEGIARPGERDASSASGPVGDGFSDDGSFYNGVRLGTGDIQLTLTWGSTADLDLHVVDPDGNEIYWEQPTSSSGGELDVDSNAGCSESTTTPVENVYWPTGDSPKGDYEVFVHYWMPCDGGSGPQDFSVTGRVGGRVVEEFDGTVRGEDERVDVVQFDR